MADFQSPQSRNTHRVMDPGLARAFEKLCVLVVDDQPISRLVMSTQLRGLGCETVEADSGLAALEKLGKYKVDVLITDCDMPYMSGFELSRRARSLESESGRKPILIVGHTASSCAKSIRDCIGAGMDVHLVKPASQEQLIAAMARCCTEQCADEQFSVKSAVSESLYDEPRIKAVTGGDDALEFALLREYVESTGRDISELEKSLAGVRYSELWRAIHRLKGAALIIGAPRLVSAVRAYEKSVAESQSFREVSGFIEDIIIAARQVKDAVVSRLEGARPGGLGCRD